MTTRIDNDYNKKTLCMIRWKRSLRYVVVSNKIDCRLARRENNIVIIRKMCNPWTNSID